MSNDLNKQTPRWLIYAVALISGLALGVTLVFITWNSALEDNKRDFSFESSRIKEDVAHNVQVSNDLVNSFTTFIEANEIFNDQIFQSFAEGILKQQLFIEGLIYSPLSIPENKMNSEFSLKVKSSRFRDKELAINGYDLGKDENFGSVLSSLLLNESTDPVVSVIKLQSRKYYILSRVILNDGYSEVDKVNPIASIRGIICLLVNTDKLIDQSRISKTLAVDLYSESSNLSGRKLIFKSVPSTNIQNSFLVSNFNEDASIQLPSYSVKLTISKDIYWQDIDQKLIYIVLFIGLGVTLLLIALVRAKDLREKELSQRNKVIELKVEEQTRELALARDQALEGSRMKSDFLASMSHEIRTPLTAIIGMAELLSETKLTNDQEKYVNVFRKAGDTLLSLVNDILDLSKIEAEQLVLEDITFDLLDVVEEAVEIYAIKAAEHHVELVSRIDSDIDTRRMGDPARLRQIILNLISNAIKFTENGHILLSVSKSSVTDELLFSVRDTGVGIPDDKQQAIFESFTQADSSTTRRYGGTGLGLTISKRLVDMMNGRIWVESEVGVGSTFSFTVNLPVNNSATRNDLYIEGFLKGKTILVVDNNEDNRIKVSKVLHKFGAEVIDTAADSSWGKLSITGIQKYQYIFLDYKTLRECTDAEMQKFRQSRKSSSGSVVIAMLGPVSLSQKIHKVNELELDGYLVKPVKQSELLHVFSEKSALAGGNVTVTEQGNAGENETALHEKRILLVEDNEDNRLLVKTYLKKFPYIIDEAENGELAVDLYRENTYNLILMDVQMPVMDGHEATRAIRVLEAEGGRPSTPIIALTAHAIKEEIDKCMAAGCDTHVGKPIKKSTLLSVIEDFST